MRLFLASMIVMAGMAMNPPQAEACGLLRGLGRVVTAPVRGLRRARMRRVANGRRVLFGNRIARRNARALQGF